MKREWLAWALVLAAFLVGCYANKQEARIQPTVADKSGTISGYIESSSPAGGVMQRVAETDTSGGAPQSLTADRKIVRSAQLSIIVKDAPTAALDVARIAERAGGYVTQSSESRSTEGGQRTAQVEMRVPAAQLDNVLDQLRHYGIRVDSEAVSANDMTAQYVDMDARLRNLRAEENQYLEIMQRAGTIKDTLAVAEQLSSTREQIEQLQGQLTLLQHQVEMSQIDVSLMPEAITQVGTVEWQPLYRAKLALRDLKEGLIDYADTALAFVIKLPLFALWLATFALFAALGFRLMRWIWRRVMSIFRRPAVAPVPATGN